MSASSSLHQAVCLILLAAFAALWPCRAVALELPGGPTPPALRMAHFPSRLHTFVWRNWEWVPPERMAKVCGCRAEDILAIGRSMGLADPPPVTDDQWRRSYITILRRNWHLLPYDQIMVLLDWDKEELAFALKEDDFLYIKLGRLKPKCDPLRYTAPTAEQQARARAIAAVVGQTFGEAIRPTGEKRFAFVDKLSRVDASARPAPPADSGSDQIKLRYLYSYFALYGDPLANPDIDPYPEGYLQKLAALGVNGVWMQAVLNQLAPSKDFPEFGKGWEQRLANLRKLVTRAKRHGIGIYLYFNEPRTQGPDFFKRFPDIRGVAEGDQIAMCVSTEKVQRYLTESTEHVFRNVPHLGGAFTISASENLTNCWSHHHGENCPRCKQRDPAEVIAATNRAMAEGVWRGNADATFIVWDWGWRDSWAERAIKALPKKCWFMSVSEWSLPIERGGVKTAVGEYSLSAVGPGPRAQRHWAIAKRCGLNIAAKMQINNTWEMAAVPYVPVLKLVGQHAKNLSELKLDGMMLSWTLGGYPSPNLELVRRLAGTDAPPVQEAMEHVARRLYGEAPAAKMVEAWNAFSEAYREYPFHGGVIYRAPHHWGPANLLYPEPTGYASTMVGIPYDDVKGWSGPYPPKVLGGQYDKIAQGWKPGLAALKAARDNAPAARRERLEDELRIAEVVYLHMRSASNQVRFVLARDALRAATDAPAEAEAKETLREVTREELDLAKRLYHITREDSRIGYEASNHYWYVPLDCAEKVVNCRYILETWLPGRP